MTDPTFMRFVSTPVALVGVFALVSTGCVLFEPPLAFDAGSDAGPPAPEDSGTDAGPTDAGPDEMDAGPGDAGPGDAGPGDAGPTDAGPPDAGPPDAGPACVVPTIVSADICLGDVVINELDGSGTDFIELYNRGSAPVNISGWLIADDSAGSPDVAEGIVVPDGTVIEPNRFLHVWANLAAPQPGVRTADCIPGAPPPCLHSSWGISSGGERTYLLDDMLTLICTFEYPSAIFGGEAFGRIPDGANSLCPTNPTAGDTNTPSSMR